MPNENSERTSVVMWRPVADDPTLEYLVYSSLDGLTSFAGTILTTEAGEPLRILYVISCYTSWQTRSVFIEVHSSERTQKLLLLYDGEGNWLRNGIHDTDLQGCIDVDLEASPCTNALPINRLALPLGATAEIRVAWIRIPSLHVQPASQTYYRTDRSRYLFTGLEGLFTAVMEVDEFGLPTSYGNLWRRAC